MENTLGFIDECIFSFISIKKANNAARNTILAYERVLNNFYECVAGEVDESGVFSMQDITKHFLMKYYMNPKLKAGLEINTQGQYLIIVKQFLNYIADEFIEYKHLRDAIRGLKIKFQTKEMDVLDENQFNKFIDNAFRIEKNGGFNEIRNSFIFKFLCFTGVRISELINLKWTNLSESEKHYSFIIKGKGNTERVVKICKELIEVNIDYLLKCKHKSEFIVTTSHGNCADRKNLYTLICNTFKQLGINKTGIHILRHSFGTNCIRNGFTDIEVQLLLGHKNSTITKRYVHLTALDKERAADRLSSFFQNKTHNSFDKNNYK